MGESKEKYLVLFSGGKDSFLSACRLINKGNEVVLISFNGGTVIGEENLKSGAQRIINRYGEANASYAGVYSTAGTIQRLNTNWLYYNQKQLGERYPELTNCQIQCLHCQTAMWTAAIAYCIAKGIKNIASGCRKSDVFCTGNSYYLSRIEDLAAKYEINITFPLWELANDWERDSEMGLYQFVPQVLEPKCLIGRQPKNNTLEGKESSDMIRYYDSELLNVVISQIDNLSLIFRHIKLSDKSLISFTLPEELEKSTGPLF